MTESPAAFLRRASTHLRALAQAASPGPWERPLNTRYKAIVTAPLPEGETGSYIDGVDRATGERERCCVVLANTWSNGKHYRKRSGRDLEYIAAMHPGVALAVADWLDAEADAHEGVMAVSEGVCDIAVAVGAGEHRIEVAASTLDQALAVARSLLGETEATR
jgi:hypothetical protein